MKSQSLDPAGRRPPNIKKNSDLFNVQSNEVNQSQHEILFTIQNILMKKCRYETISSLALMLICE